MAITDLTPFSGTKPNKDTQSSEAFDTNVQNWVDYTTELPDEINDFIDELEVEINKFAANIAGATANVSIYAAGTTYSAGNQVLDPNDNYRMYTSQQGSNTGNTPSDDDGTYWRETFGNTGADAISSAVDITLTSASKQIQVITITEADKFVVLPSATGLQKSTDTFVFFNKGAYRFGVKDSSGNFICSIAAYRQGRIRLTDNSTEAGIWQASDGADLMMNRLKTVCNADGSTRYVSACKLTPTEIFVAWSGSDTDGYCAVLTWTGSAITVSNILEFDTTNAEQISCCRMTDTTTIVGYRGASSYGVCTAITYDGTNTLTVIDTHTFKSAAIVSVKLLPIHEDETTGKIGVFYIEGTNIYAQVLNWTGTEITTNTAETGIFTGTTSTYLSATLLSGAVWAASMLIGYVATNSFRMKHVTWGGTTLTPHIAAETAGTIIEAATTTYNTIVAIDSNYAVAFAHFTGASTDYNSIMAYLLYWNGTGISVKMAVKLSDSKDGYVFDQNAALLIDPVTVGFVCDPDLNGYSTMYKIKAVGSTESKECVLFVESKINLGKSDPNATDRTAINFDSTGAIFLYSDQDLATSYLAAQRIDIGV